MKFSLCMNEWVYVYISYIVAQCNAHIYVWFFRCSLRSMLICFKHSTTNRKKIAGNVFLFLFCGLSAIISMCSFDFVNQLCMFYLIFRNICGGEEKCRSLFFCAVFALFSFFFSKENMVIGSILCVVFAIKCRKTFLFRKIWWSEIMFRFVLNSSFLLKNCHWIQ